MTPAERRAKRRGAYADLKAAIQEAELTYQAVELLTLPEIRTLIGEKALGLSGTFIKNMQRKAVAQMKRQELRSIANWIESRVSGQYPNVEAVPRRDRTIKVYLDGLPEVIEP